MTSSHDPDNKALPPSEIRRLLTPGWEQHGQAISKTYSFENYYHTIAFVNAVAWMAHREDHHPDLTVGYNRCRVAFTTHAINGLSASDFICAAKADALFMP